MSLSISSVLDSGLGVGEYTARVFLILFPLPKRFPSDSEGVLMSELCTALDTWSRAWLYVSECRIEIGMHKLIQ